MRRALRLASLALAFTLLATACSDAPWSTEPGQISAAVWDGAHGGGNPDFFFLAPLVADPSSNADFEAGRFNPRLHPVMVVFPLSGADPVCDLKNLSSAVGGVVAVPVDSAHEKYQVEWNTERLGADHEYRLCVFSSRVGKLLGFLDIKPVRTEKLQICKPGTRHLAGWLDTILSLC